MYHVIVVLVAMFSQPGGLVAEKAQLQVAPDTESPSLSECRDDLHNNPATQRAVAQSVSDIGKFMADLETEGQLLRVHVRVRCIKVGTTVKQALEQEGFR